MNILFFLTPKKDVTYIYSDDTLRSVMETMEYHQYSSIPMIDKDGKYIGTVTEGDLLWSLNHQVNFNLKRAERISIGEIKRRRDYQPVYIEVKMDDLIGKAMSQNFVPVVDDQKMFIGIITRKDIIQYCYEKLNKKEK